MIRRWGAVALAGVLVAAAAPAAFAQSRDSQENLQKKLEAKLGEDWVASGGWVTDFEEAMAQAKESGKPIVAYFTRSYSP